MEDPRPTAAIAHEPPVIVASGERRSKGVRRPSRSVRGIPLSNLIAVHASVFRHGPSRSPAGLIIPTVGRDRTIAIDKQVTTVSRTGWTKEKAYRRSGCEEVAGMRLAQKLNLKDGMKVRVIGKPAGINLDDVVVT